MITADMGWQETERCASNFLSLHVGAPEYLDHIRIKKNNVVA